MSSFLDKCKKCGSMIAKGTTCPNCHYSEKHEEEGGSEASQALMEEYARRHALHIRNYTIFMALVLTAGILSMGSGYVIYRRVARTPLIGGWLVLVLFLLSLLAAGFLPFAKIYFPHALHCPSCDVRLDEIKMVNGCCPGCHARLE